jgi:seryl-tRNA synthetase
MIDIKHLAQNVERYREELTKRGGNPDFATQAKENYEIWKNKKTEIDPLLEKKNDFNKKIGTLSPEERQSALVAMKTLSDEIKAKEDSLREAFVVLTKSIAKIPNLTYDDIPV